MSRRDEMPVVMGRALDADPEAPASEWEEPTREYPNLELQILWDAGLLAEGGEA